MSSNVRCLERSLHILGPILGQRLGAQVRIGGARACTDGRVILLPSLPPDDETAAVLGFGHLFHEANHVRETDFSVEREGGLLAQLSNALEDIRVDALGFGRYPGGRQDREQLIGVLQHSGQLLVAAADDAPAHQLQAYLFWRLEHESLGLQAAAPLARQCETVFRGRFAPAVATKLDALMFQVEQCRSTAEVVALARRIVAMLQQESQPTRPPVPDGAAASGGTSTSTHAQAAPPAAAQAALRELLETPADAPSDGLGEWVAAALEQHAQEVRDRALPLVQAQPPSPARAELAQAFVQAALAHSLALRHRMNGLLQAQEPARVRHGMSGRQLDPKRLAGLRAGRQQVFRRLAPRRRQQAVVQLLVDRSGSMDGERIALARPACYALALALQALPGVRAAAAAFPGQGEHAVQHLMPWESRAERQAGAFAALEATGGTPLREALLWGAGELLRQRERRRLLLVLTDGAYAADRARPTLAALAGSGIECAAVGIGCEVGHLFACHRRVDDPRELVRALFELLTELLRRVCVAA